MKIRFEFEIEPRCAEEIDADEFCECCDSIEELETQLLDWPEPHWRVYVNKEDLAALWAEVQKLRERK